MSSSSNNGHATDVKFLQRRTMRTERSETGENATSAACLSDTKRIQKLERELMNCSQEIEYLQDQLNLRDVEANFMGEHVHSLELKLAEFNNLHERLRLTCEELAQSDSQRLLLVRELKCKEEELKISALHIETLETAILDSQCEIESLKLDITAIEQRCLKAERFCWQADQERDRMNSKLEELQFRFQEAQQVIHHLENENKKLQEKIQLSESNTKDCFHRVEEQLHKWLEHCNKMGIHNSNESTHALQLNASKELPLAREMCTCGEFLDPFLSKLAVVASSDEHAKNEIEKMTNQIHESELLVKRLKEELRQEKLKAKEEAEDLTQEMAELRYQIMGMLEEECKRRACIEQASIQRIKDLEAQVQKEKKKSIAAIKHFQEIHELAERRFMEVRKLKDALEKLHQCTDLKNASGNEHCICSYCMISLSSSDCRVEARVDAESTENTSNIASIEWFLDEASRAEDRQDANVSKDG